MVASIASSVLFRRHSFLAILPYTRKRNWSTLSRNLPLSFLSFPARAIRLCVEERAAGSNIDSMKADKIALGSERQLLPLALVVRNWDVRAGQVPRVADNLLQALLPTLRIFLLMLMLICFIYWHAAHAVHASYIDMLHLLLLVLLGFPIFAWIHFVQSGASQGPTLRDKMTFPCTWWAVLATKIRILALGCVAFPNGNVREEPMNETGCWTNPHGGATWRHGKIGNMAQWHQSMAWPRPRLYNTIPKWGSHFMPIIVFHRAQPISASGWGRGLANSMAFPAGHDMFWLGKITATLKQDKGKSTKIVIRRLADLYPSGLDLRSRPGTLHDALWSMMSELKDGSASCIVSRGQQGQQIKFPSRLLCKYIRSLASP